MKLSKRVGALSLALAIVLGCLSGCKSSESPSASVPDSSFTVPESVDLSAVTDPYLTVSGLSGDTVVATAGETEITAAQLLYWIAYSADSLLQYYSIYTGITELPWDTEVDGATLADSIKKNSLDTAVLYALIPQMGRDEGVTISQEFTDSFEQSLTQMSESLGGDELMTHALWYYPLTQDLYTFLCQSEEINTQTMNARYGEGSEGYPTDEQVISFLEDDQQCYFFKHILFLVEETTGEDGTTTDNSQEQKAKAEEVLAQLRASEDPLTLFDQLMNEYSEDGGLAAYPDGYLGTASETASVGNVMVSVVENACLTMDDYEISDVLENTEGSYHGYHIVLKLPVAGNVSPDEYRQSYIAVLMDQLQQEYVAANPVVTNENYDKINAADFYAALTVLRAAVDAEQQAKNESASSAAGSSASSASTSSQG